MCVDKRHQDALYQYDEDDCSIQVLINSKLFQIARLQDSKSNIKILSSLHCIDIYEDDENI